MITTQRIGKDVLSPKFNTQRSNSAQLFSIEEREETQDSASKNDAKEESNKGSPSGLFNSERSSKENN